MKTAFSLTLIACLVGSALPVAAEDRLEPASGPITRAVLREAGLLVAAQPNAPADRNWSRVRQLAPGTEIIMTVEGSPPGKRYVVHANESDVTVLNLADPLLPAAAARLLREVAAHHAESFQPGHLGGGFADNNVRVGREGVFVADRKVADLRQVVETIPRTDVVEIKGPVSVRGSVHGAILGTWLGSSVGLALGTSAPSAPLGWSLLTGLTVLGAGLGYRWSSHKATGVIYRSAKRPAGHKQGLVSASPASAVGQ